MRLSRCSHSSPDSRLSFALWSVTPIVTDHRVYLAWPDDDSVTVERSVKHLHNWAWRTKDRNPAKVPSNLNCLGSKSAVGEQAGACNVGRFRT